MNRLYTVLIFVAILAMATYFLFSALQPQYFLRTSFILVPKNDSIGLQMDRVVNDVVFVMREAVSSDTTIANSDAKVYITQEEHTNIVSVYGYANTPDMTKSAHSRALSQTVRNVRQFYGDDVIAMQVVHHERMPHKTFSAQIFPYLIILFVGIGLIAGIFSLFHYIERFRDQRVQAPSISGEKIFEKFHTKKRDASIEYAGEDFTQKEVKVDAEKRETSEIEKSTEEKTEHHTKEKIEHNHKKAVPPSMHKPTTPDIAIPDGISATPGNLPVVDISNLGFAAKKEERMSQEEEQVKEPTEEELKARLNALLNGKL